MHVYNYPLSSAVLHDSLLTVLLCTHCVMSIMNKAVFVCLFASGAQRKPSWTKSALSRTQKMLNYLRLWSNFLRSRLSAFRHSSISHVNDVAVIQHIRISTAGLQANHNNYTNDDRLHTGAIW